MLHIMLACARTHEFVSTGIEIDIDTFIALPEVLSLMQCPACGQTHHLQTTRPRRNQLAVCHVPATL
jgi:hypothetical protein